ncbi:MAG: hypothetical protein A2V88_01430 [Elusimicrobia bacterium RBG_16_66_12]|nr:MAG: hypothetical protein A2V88_01430 [Elusimicrobia bacterium RBG_16_66_12]
MALSVALLCSTVGCRRAVAESRKGVDWSREIGKGVKTIRMNIESPATIRLVPAAGVVGVSEMVYQGFAADPVSVETADAVVTIHQARGEKAQASYTLKVPKGMDIEINGGILNLTGELAAGKLDIRVGMLNSEAGMTAKSIIIRSSMLNLSGRIEAPTVSVKSSMISNKARLEIVADESVDIDSKMGRMDVSVTRSRRVDIAGGMVSGRVEVPGDAVVNSAGDVKIARKL